MIDYHIHSLHSGDTPVTIREMCVRAVELELTEIAFTEHLDFTPTDLSYGAFKYSNWIEDITAAREEFSDRLVIRRGVEVDYQTRYHSQIEDFLNSHEFDIKLGSAHYVEGILLEDHEAYFPNRSIRDAYAPYFDVAFSAVESGLFDSLAHFDLCKRYGVLYYGPFHIGDFLTEVEAVLKAIIKQEMAIEINTSGLRQAPGETYPAIDMLNLYKKFGGSKVTIGSDSHLASHLGYGIPEAYEMLNSLKFEPSDVTMLRHSDRP